MKEYRKKHGYKYFKPKKYTSLRRNEYNGWIGGVCQSIGNYYKMDPNIIRFLFLTSFFAKGAGLLLYIILWIIIPEK